MGTRIRITNNSKQPQDIGGRWVQPGASDVFDADQVAPEWRAGAVVVESDDPRAGELEREGDRLYVRKADGSRNSLVEAGIGPGGGIEFDRATAATIQRGMGYEPLRNVEWTELTAADVRPIASRMNDGYIYGTKTGLLYRSADGARTWEQVGAASLSGGNTPMMVLRLGDGEALVCGSLILYRTSGWGTAGVTSAPVLTSTTANFLEWGIDTTPDGQCVATHYAAGDNFTASRYVWYSDDSGATWRVIRDLDSDSKNDRHIHFAVFDPYQNNRIYISHHHESEGGSGKAIEYTDDAGTNWNEVANITITDDAGAARVVQPTTAAPTPDGLVFGSDDTWTGLYILRRGSSAIEKLAAGSSSVATSTVTGFATYSQRDQVTGDIYTCWVQSLSTSIAYVMASDGVGGSVIYSMPEAYPTTGFGGQQGLPGFSWLTFTDDELIVMARRPSAITPVDNAYWMMRAPRPRRLARVADPADGVPVLYGAKWRPNCPAIGLRAESVGQDSLAVGYNARALNTTGCTVVGNGSTTDGQKTVVIGNGVNAPHSFSVAIGDGAVITGAYAVRIGSLGNVSANAVSIGYDAVAYNGAVAIGTSCKMAAGSADGVAIGRSVAGASFAVAIAYGATVAAGGIAVGYNAKSGNGVAIGYGAQRTASQSGIVAVGRNALCGADDTIAIGKSASAAHLNAVALGASVATARTNSIAVGDRDIELQGNGRGVILRSPNGTLYKLSVSDAGAVTVAAV